MTRRRTETTLAILLAAAMLAVGGGVLLFVFTIAPVHTDPAAVPSTALVRSDRYADAIQESDRLVRALLVAQNMPGLAVAVGADGSTAWAEAFGWADVEGKAPMTPHTRFRLGSASRPLTAAAVGLLRERGRIDLDAPIQRYVTAYPEKPWPITTRQLMGDVAGVHHLRGDQEIVPPGGCANLDEALRLFAADPLASRPGTQYRYSIYGWILVSAAIESAAGQAFPAFMTREVFPAFGMTDTLFDGPDLQGRARPYFPRSAMRTSLGLQDAPDADYSCFAGAGALVSTPADLVRFGLAMLNPGLLTGETLALLQTPVTLESGATSPYALGWTVDRQTLAGAPARVLSHRGSPMGGTVSLVLFPDHGLVIALASNVSYATGVAPLALQIAEAFAKPTGGSIR